ncbi:MAG: hypothetical protein A2X08_10455 [Bacteroidetes bacterium GWA2_32_17]|nr:MAG: hypothetical protein A2X08_10455 [Bacteroidetes bacterium GWA2_32_17]
MAGIKLIEDKSRFDLDFNVPQVSNNNQNKGLFCKCRRDSFVECECNGSGKTLWYDADQQKSTGCTCYKHEHIQCKCANGATLAPLPK